MVITNKDQVGNRNIGGKAKNLFHLKEMGMNVPGFIVLPVEIFDSLLPPGAGETDHDNPTAVISQVIIPPAIIENIITLFPATEYFAVRSSAIDEDGTDFSFAGQFESFLFVTKENLAEKIKAVWCSAFSTRVSEYRANNKLKLNAGIAVIIQEMIDARSAGVAFGVNPVTGNTNEKFISSVFGLGEGIVSGELNADNFIVNNGKITSQPAVKTHKIIFDKEALTGTKKVGMEEQQQLLPSLPDKIILELDGILNKLLIEYGKPQDIEFAVQNEKLFLLQTRPVTTIQQFNNSQKEYTVWDNSNIIESYPGVTTPLTFSFISRSYESAYKLFSRYLGVSQKVIKQHGRVFANTLGLINGRVYYNLKTWYHMLAMLPGYSINARYMEKMMGVKERFDIPETYRLSKGKAWIDILKMAVNMYIRFISLPRKRKEFKKLLDTTITAYKEIDLSKKNANELMQLYIAFEKTLLNEWKAPLLNDFFAMIWFGMLQKRCEKYQVSKNPNIHNDLLCGSSDIISTQPIHRSIELAGIISSDNELKQLFISQSEEDIWHELTRNKNERYISLKRKIDTYITDFGERCIGELKLETVSYTREPSKFIKVLRSYVENEITLETTSGTIEETIRTNAEQQVEQALRYSPYKKWKLKRTLKHARELVSARENLRYERTRAFGIVREIFSHIGKNFYKEGIIEHPHDIFYLTLQEIFFFIEGTSVTQNIKALITLRRSEFTAYQDQMAPAERFSTYGIVYHLNDFFSNSRAEINKDDLKGIGCCPGRVKGKVRVVMNPGEVSSLQGDILVTSSTDPGWVTLFPSASGIIVERGSVLSHSAIVSREMGKPCIVSVTGLLKRLTTGDEIEMDGSTGEIKIIKKHE